MSYLIKKSSMDYSILGSILPRYIRIIGDSSSERDIPKIGGVSPQKVNWAPGMYCVPGYISIRDRDGDYEELPEIGLYPMDIASWLAVMSLKMPNNSQAISVLDLCCCPGSKLQLISEKLNNNSIVVGVDISTQRLNVCKSILRSLAPAARKFCTTGCGRKLVFQCDGTKFNQNYMGELVYDSTIIDEEIIEYGSVKKRNKSYRERETKRLKTQQNSWIAGISKDENTKIESSIILDQFDYVLVDAECTHDASYKHMKYVPHQSTLSDFNIDNSSANKCNTSGLTKPKAQLSHYNNNDDNTTPTTMSTLENNTASIELLTLQRSLLMNGFQRLIPGGSLVYSTCSQDRSQNEDIIQWFLDTVGGEAAELVDVCEVLDEVLAEYTAEPDNCAGVKCTDSDATTATAATTGIITTTTPAEDHCSSTIPNTDTIEDSPLQLLQLDLPDLFTTLREEYPSTEALHSLSTRICQAVTALPVPLLTTSVLLPGTLRLSYRNGMSGHFIAKIKKIC